MSWETQNRRAITCSQCGLTKPHKAHGLCSKCYGALPRPSARRRWVQMIRRCTKPTDPAWELYGGRGIKVCDRWLNSFENYYKDVGDAPAGRSLDRVDNDGDYEPGNVRWATPSQQALNQRHFFRLKTHCPQDHPYDDINTYIDGLGKRQCRTCSRNRHRRGYRAVAS